MQLFKSCQLTVQIAAQYLMCLYVTLYMYHQILS